MARTKTGRKRRYSVSLSDGVVKKILELGVQLAGTTSLSEAVEHSIAFAHVEMFGKQVSPNTTVPVVKRVKSAVGMIAVAEDEPEPVPEALPDWEVEPKKQEAPTLVQTMVDARIKASELVVDGGAQVACKHGAFELADCTEGCADSAPEPEGVHEATSTPATDVAELGSDTFVAEGEGTEGNPDDGWDN